MKELYQDRSVKIAANLIMLVLIVFICYTLQSIIVPILFSIILSVLILPLAERLEKWGLGRVASSILTLIFFIILVCGIGYVLISQTINIGQDATDIVDKIRSLGLRILDWASDKFHMSKNEIIGRAETELSNSATSIGGYITGMINSIGNSLSFGILVPIMIFFFLYYRDFFKEFFCRVFSSSPREEIENLIAKIYDVLQNYLVGLVTVMGIIAILNTIGLMLLGIDYSWFFGILAALLTIFPYVGIFIGSIIPALFALATKDSAWYAAGVIIWFQLVQTLEGNFITPKIVGGKANLNPFVSLLSFFLGGMLFGISGMILALPLLAILKVIFDSIPETQAYGFLLSEPDDTYVHSQKQKRKRELKRQSDEELVEDATPKK